MMTARGQAGRRRYERGTALVLGAALGFGGLAAGCTKSEAPATDGGIFLAFASDFADFRSWPSNTTDIPVDEGATHVAGPRTIYINQFPPTGATSFPIGTMIVKVTETDGRIFGRAKRGGNFNPSGAVNWEWFELLEGADGVSIRWHGFGPPAGEAYGGDPSGGCNGCHGQEPDNDYVLSDWLQLNPAEAEAGASFVVDAGDGSAAAPAPPVNDGSAAEVESGD
jgi:hypothetical protein